MIKFDGWVFPKARFVAAQVRYVSAREWHVEVVVDGLTNGLDDRLTEKFDSRDKAQQRLDAFLIEFRDVA